MEEPIRTESSEAQKGRCPFLPPLCSEKRFSKTFFGVVFGVILFAIFIFWPFIAPFGFPAGQTITVEKDASLGQVSYALKDHSVIRSRMAFEFCMILFNGDKHVVAGDYLFKEPVGACAVASRIASGTFGVPVAKVTFPEGVSNAQMADILNKQFPQFDAQGFIADAKAKSLEGYLFPETYFFSQTPTILEVETMLSAQFDKNITPLASAIEKSGHSQKDIVIMASILEKEARTPEDQAIVAGVLWTRIARGMPLQVDAPFLYLLGKESSELSLNDLAMNSGYNTYKNKGLPVGPIGNPGLSAIKAAIFPTKSSYVYYLSDKDGVMHYAKTFDEHKANKTKYLR